MTTYWAETRATFNNEYTGPFKSAMVKSSGYLTELSQVTNVYANLTSSTNSTRRKLLSAIISIDVSFMITIDLTSLGLTASDATSAVTSFTENLIQSMNATDNTSFAYSFLYAAAVAGLDWNITFYPDVEATAATLETMTSSINVVTQPPTKAPTKAPTKKPTPSPTTGPTTSVITTSGAAGWMPSYLVALICVCLSGWQLLKH